MYMVAQIHTNFFGVTTALQSRTNNENTELWALVIHKSKLDLAIEVILKLC